MLFRSFSVILKIFEKATLNYRRLVIEQNSTDREMSTSKKLKDTTSITWLSYCILVEWKPSKDPGNGAQYLTISLIHRFSRSKLH